MDKHETIVVEDCNARNAIPTEDRVEGMEVFVECYGVTYRLNEGMDNNSWRHVTGK